MLIGCKFSRIDLMHLNSSVRGSEITRLSYVIVVREKHVDNSRIGRSILALNREPAVLLITGQGIPPAASAFVYALPRNNIILIVSRRERAGALLLSIGCTNEKSAVSSPEKGASLMKGHILAETQLMGKYSR